MVNEKTIKIWDPFGDPKLPALTALLSEVMGTGPKSESWFLWKHRDNPWGPSIVVYALDGVGDVIAMRAFWQWRLWFGGRQWQAFQPCDTATRPDCRRQGLFTELTKSAMEEARRQGGQLLFNFPAQASFPGYLKLGWTDIGGMLALMLPRRPLRLAGEFARRWGRPGRFTPDRRDPAALARPAPWGNEVVLPRSADRDLVAGTRTVSMLQWRFGEHPLTEYQLVGDTTRGLLVRTGWRGGLREASIVEVFGEQLTTATLRDLVDHAGDFVEADIVTVVLSEPHMMARRFREAGFRSMPNRINLVARPLLMDCQRFAQLKWGVIGADIDAF